MGTFNYKLRDKTIILEFNYGQGNRFRISTGYKVSNSNNWLDSQNIRFQNQKACIHENLEDYVTAKKILKAILSLDPSYAMAWHKLGQILKKMNKLEEALEALEALKNAIELAPENIEIRNIYNKLRQDMKK